MGRARPVLTAAGVFALAIAFPALAGLGGASIASAPNAPLGQRVVSKVAWDQGLSNTCQRDGYPGEFWRVTIPPRAEVSIDFQSLNYFDHKHGGRGVRLGLLAPDITDANVWGAYCYADQTIGDYKQHFWYRPRVSGRWTIVFIGLDQPPRGLFYAMTVRVRRHTHTTLSAPRRVQAGARFSVEGAVSGASRGSVSLRFRSGTRGQWHWRRLGAARLASDGSFSFQQRISAPGRHRVQVVFGGDGSHLPSSATATIAVA